MSNVCSSTQLSQLPKTSRNQVSPKAYKYRFTQMLQQSLSILKLISTSYSV